MCVYNSVINLMALRCESTPQLSKSKVHTRETALTHTAKGTREGNRQGLNCRLRPTAPNQYNKQVKACIRVPHRTGVAKSETNIIQKYKTLNYKIQTINQ